MKMFDLSGAACDSLLAPLLEWASRKPDRIAVKSDTERVTYGDLVAAGFDYARSMSHLPSGSLIAVLLERGVDHIAAELGILLAGHCYAPLDPSWPEERVRSICRSADVLGAIVPESSRAHIASFVPVIGKAASDGEAPPRPVRRSPDNLAYVIHTSGSTGEPKGVMIEDAAVCNTLDDVCDRFGVTDASTILALSSPTFDLAIFDVLGSLRRGATVVLPHVSQGRDPHEWLQLVGRHGVTVWNSVPALADMLATYAEVARADRESAHAIDSLQLFMLSGDWIPPALPARLRALAPSASIVSLGGATEASIWSIYFDVDPAEDYGDSVPYGFSLANQEVLVLNDDLEQCPQGFTGELYIAGAGLARGYRNDAARTASAFIHHPRTGLRMYRTGDLGCYRTDRSITFLGRRDSQVKVSGFRIELGEIEAVAAAHDAIARCAAVPLGPVRARTGIALAFVGQGTVSEAELRTVLSSRLPAYMLPSRYKRVDALPLTENGKVDRHALARLFA